MASRRFRYVREKEDEMSKCPTCGQEIDDDLRSLEMRIFELNREIRSVPGMAPTPEWREMKQQHERLMREYRAMGGTQLGRVP